MHNRWFMFAPLQEGCLWAAVVLSSCTTTSNPIGKSDLKSPAPTSDSPVTAEPDDDSDRKMGVLKVEKSNPGSTQIMRDSCRGRYKVLPERDAKRPQMEIGVARAVGGGSLSSGEKTPYPYIRYRCED